MTENGDKRGNKLFLDEQQRNELATAKAIGKQSFEYDKKFNRRIGNRTALVSVD